MAKTDSNSATHWKKQFNYDYLGSYSLEKDQEMILTIKETKKQDVKGVGGKSQQCFIATFEEPVKPMILNKTNCKTISKVYGTPYIEDWKGLKIIVYAKNGIEAFGDTVDALRIRDYKPGDNILEEIKLLLQEKKQNLHPDQIERANDVISNQQKEFYKSLLKLLKSL